MSSVMTTYILRFYDNIRRYKLMNNLIRRYKLIEPKLLTTITLRGLTRSMFTREKKNSGTRLCSKRWLQSAVM